MKLIKEAGGLISRGTDAEALTSSQGHRSQSESVAAVLNSLEQDLEEDFDSGQSKHTLPFFQLTSPLFLVCSRLSCTHVLLCSLYLTAFSASSFFVNCLTCSFFLIYCLDRYDVQMQQLFGDEFYTQQVDMNKEKEAVKSIMHDLASILLPCFLVLLKISLWSYFLLSSQKFNMNLRMRAFHCPPLGNPIQRSRLVCFLLLVTGRIKCKSKSQATVLLSLTPRRTTE